MYEMLIARKFKQRIVLSNPSNLLGQQILVPNVVLTHKQQHYYSESERGEDLKKDHLRITFIAARPLFSTLVKPLNFVAPSASANKIH